MSFSRRLFLVTLSTLGACLLFFPSPGWCQVSPAEILNPQLKALEKAHMEKLVKLNHEISDLQFPFKFAIARHVGLDPKDQLGADSRGIEFVNFHGRMVLKISGNYNAAFNSDLLTQNERATHVLDDVVAPILHLLPKYFPPSPSFDAFGFEISYHVRTHSKQFGYEGKEFLVLVFDKVDVAAYLNAPRESQKQEIIDRSQVFLDGNEFGLALGQHKAFDVAQLDKSKRPDQVQAAVVAGHTDNQEPDPAPTGRDSDLRLAGLFSNTPTTFRLPRPIKPAANSAAPALPAAPSATSTPAAFDLDALQKKYQPQLDALTSDGLAHHHFVNYASASIGVFHNQAYLQITLRNPTLYDRNSTSIYKRAAQSFDLFLAPQLKGILGKIPSDPEISGVDVTVLDEFSRSAPSSSEALEFISPLGPLRQFADAEITNQDLINQSVVLVNGVRIALSLEQVE